MLSLSFLRRDLCSLQRVPMTSSSKEYNAGLHRFCLPPPCPKGTQTLFTPPDVSNTSVVFPQFASTDFFEFVFNLSQATVIQMGSGPHSWPQRAHRASPVCPYKMSEDLQTALSLLPNRCPWSIPALSSLLATRLTPNMLLQFQFIFQSVFKDTSVIFLALLSIHGCVSSTLDMSFKTAGANYRCIWGSEGRDTG